MAGAYLSVSFSFILVSKLFPPPPTTLLHCTTPLLSANQLQTAGWLMAGAATAAVGVQVTAHIIQAIESVPLLASLEILVGAAVTTNVATTIAGGGEARERLEQQWDEFVKRISGTYGLSDPVFDEMESGKDLEAQIQDLLSQCSAIIADAAAQHSERRPSGETQQQRETRAAEGLRRAAERLDPKPANSTGKGTEGEELKEGKGKEGGEATSEVSQRKAEVEVGEEAVVAVRKAELVRVLSEFVERREGRARRVNRMLQQEVQAGRGLEGRLGDLTKQEVQAGRRLEGRRGDLTKALEVRTLASVAAAQNVARLQALNDSLQAERNSVTSQLSALTNQITGLSTSLDVLTRQQDSVSQSNTVSNTVVSGDVRCVWVGVCERGANLRTRLRKALLEKRQLAQSLRAAHRVQSERASDVEGRLRSRTVVHGIEPVAQVRRASEVAMQQQRQRQREEVDLQTYLTQHAAIKSQRNAAVVQASDLERRVASAEAQLKEVNRSRDHLFITNHEVAIACLPPHHGLTGAPPSGICRSSAEGAAMSENRLLQQRVDQLQRTSRHSAAAFRDRDTDEILSAYTHFHSCSTQFTSVYHLSPLPIPRITSIRQLNTRLTAAMSENRLLQQRVDQLQRTSRHSAAAFRDRETTLKQHLAERHAELAASRQQAAAELARVTSRLEAEVRAAQEEVVESKGEVRWLEEQVESMREEGLLHTTRLRAAVAAAEKRAQEEAERANELQALLAERKETSDRETRLLEEKVSSLESKLSETELKLAVTVNSAIATARSALLPPTPASPVDASLLSCEGFGSSIENSESSTPSGSLNSSEIGSSMSSGSVSSSSGGRRGRRKGEKSRSSSPARRPSMEGSTEGSTEGTELVKGSSAAEGTALGKDESTKSGELGKGESAEGTALEDGGGVVELTVLGKTEGPEVAELEQDGSRSEEQSTEGMEAGKAGSEELMGGGEASSTNEGAGGTLESNAAADAKAEAEAVAEAEPETSAVAADAELASAGAVPAGVGTQGDGNGEEGVGALDASAAATVHVEEEEAAVIKADVEERAAGPTAGAEMLVRGTPNEALGTPNENDLKVYARAIFPAYVSLDASIMEQSRGVTAMVQDMVKMGADKSWAKRHVEEELLKPALTQQVAVAAARAVGTRTRRKQGRQAKATNSNTNKSADEESNAGDLDGKVVMQ
ncbi:unnamed protein product [Closterium sp. Naga37s-1]|nr:unnamed protein product [Closterium sp. Naga37s-1]